MAPYEYKNNTNIIKSIIIKTHNKNNFVNFYIKYFSNSIPQSGLNTTPSSEWGQGQPAIYLRCKWGVHSVYLNILKVYF